MARWIDLCYSCFIFSVYIVNIASNATTAKYGNDEHVIVTECRTPNHDIGLCIRFKQCNVLFNQMNNTEAHNFLKASRCGSAKDDDSNPRVCCGKYDNFLPVVSRNRIFPTSCGRQDVTLEKRIVGGTEAGLGEFPWMVRLMYKNKNGEKIFGCSGFLINYRHVVTAAHCTHPGYIGDKTIVAVVLGEHNTETNPDCSADWKTCHFRHIRRVTKVIIHPGYSPQSRAYYSDIAILQLRSGVRRSKYVQPICVLWNDSQIPARYYVSGWGKTEKDIVTECVTPNHDQGYCMEIQHCKKLIAQVTNPEAKAFLLASACGPRNQNVYIPKVCCGKYDNYIITNSRTKEVVETEEDIFPKSCGRQNMTFDRRIIGGTEASLGEYPWMVRLMHKSKSGSQTAGCSGFLIHPNFVLTAAHCTHPKRIELVGPVYVVVLGEHNTDTTIDCSSGNLCAKPNQIRRVANVVTHPEYNPEDSAYYNDIALIHLKKAAQISNFVQPICLFKVDSPVPSRYYLSGWGKTEKEIINYCDTPNYDKGLCIEIKKCHVLVKQINNNETWPFIRASRCDESDTNFNKSTYKVCCGKYDHFRNVSKDIVEGDVFPKSCSYQKELFRPRILGGTEASLGEYPWMALLIQKNQNRENVVGCAGFLIHTKYVITAAHCTHPKIVKQSGTIFSVLLGEHNIQTTTDCVGKVCVNSIQNLRITKVITHPDFNPSDTAYHNDIAIIKLRSEAVLTDYVQPICLVENDNQTSTKYYISGWGNTEKGTRSNVKMKLEIPHFNKTQCIEKYSGVNIAIRDTQICAGGEYQKDTCSGDSGGPLMVSKDNDIWYATGIVSFGMGCGEKGWPGVYTSIGKFLPWIKSQMTQT